MESVRTSLLVHGLSVVCLAGGACAAPTEHARIRDRPEDEPAFFCPGAAGSPRVMLCEPGNPEEPVVDGQRYEVKRQPQGAIVVLVPLWFGGLNGGDHLESLALRFEVGDVVVASRHSRGFSLPCDAEGRVAADWIEVFLGPGTAAGQYDGVEGRLVVEATTEDGLLVIDEVIAVLDHPVEGG